MIDSPISMYVPARNAERTLPACVSAIQAQTRTPDELFILADPRSTDRTLEVARALGVPTIEQTGDTLGSARNQALMAARHRWVACCDSDVNIQPDWLARLADRRGEGAAGIGGQSLEHIRTPFDEWRALQMPHHWGPHAFRNPFMLVSEVLFDRDALVGIGGYRDDLNYYEDSDLCQRLRDAGFDLFYEPAAVAHHQRSDHLLSLLDLRWKYSEYRQQHLLDRYADLVRKTAVNHEYASTTLSRSLARGRECLSYISFLLYFHHLLMDLRSLQSRRPLMSAAHRAACERRLLGTAIQAAAASAPDLAERVQQDLVGRIALEPGMHPVQLLPVWAAYEHDVAEAVQRFVRELEPVLHVIGTSCRYLHEETPRESVAKLSAVSPQAMQSVLARLELHPWVGTSLRDDLLRRWPEIQGIDIVGTASDKERAALQSTGTREATAEACIVPHLEARVDPLGAFQELSTRYRRLVACYRAPARFIAGLDVASAADLAAAAAAGGWTIEHFDTLVGRTRLTLSTKNVGLP